MTIHATDTSNDRPAQHRRSPWIALFLLIALVITMAGVFPFRQIIAQHRQVALTEEKLDALLTENARLEGQIDDLGTPAEVERIAREQLGLVRPGETAVTVNRPRTDPVPAYRGPAVATDRPEQEDRSLLGQFWDFLTGRDLEPDG
ncbi:MAG: septum formation initiator family protein [Acidimicrobiia bacterium]